MKWFNKLFIGFAVIFAGFQAFVAGLDAGKHYYSQMTFDLLMGLFWLFLGGFWLYMEVDRFITKREQERLEKADGIVDEMLKVLKDAKIGVPKMVGVKNPSHHEQLTNVLMEIIDEKTEGKPPTEEQVREIEAEFGERTNHTLKLKLQPGGMEVHIEGPSKPVRRNRSQKDKQ